MHASAVTLLGAALLFCSCASTTTIISDPPGATVHDKNGVELGKTPYEFTTKDSVFDSRVVEVRKRGYEPKIVELQRSEIDVVPFIASISCMFCLGVTTLVGFIPAAFWFWYQGFKYPEETRIKLHKKAGAGGDVAALMGEVFDPARFFAHAASQPAA